MGYRMQHIHVYGVLSNQVPGISLTKGSGFSSAEVIKPSLIRTHRPADNDITPPILDVLRDGSEYYVTQPVSISNPGMIIPETVLPLSNLTILHYVPLTDDRLRLEAGSVLKDREEILGYCRKILSKRDDSTKKPGNGVSMVLSRIESDLKHHRSSGPDLSMLSHMMQLCAHPTAVAALSAEITAIIGMTLAGLEHSSDPTFRGIRKRLAELSAQQLMDTRQMLKLAQHVSSLDVAIREGVYKNILGKEKGYKTFKDKEHFWSWATDSAQQASAVITALKLMRAMSMCTSISYALWLISSYALQLTLAHTIHQQNN